jgi:hypothetical protein
MNLIPISSKLVLIIIIITIYIYWIPHCSALLVRMNWWKSFVDYLWKLSSIWMKIFNKLVVMLMIPTNVIIKREKKNIFMCMHNDFRYLSSSYPNVSLLVHFLPSPDWLVSISYDHIELMFQIFIKLLFQLSHWILILNFMIMYLITMFQFLMIILNWCFNFSLNYYFNFIWILILNFMITYLITIVSILILNSYFKFHDHVFNYYVSISHWVIVSIH